MPDQKDPNEILRLYSSDLLELHRRIADMVKDQAEDEEIRRYPRVQQIINRTRETVDRHISELEQNVSDMGGEESSWLKQAMGTAAGAAMGMAAKAEGGEKCSKMLRNNYAALDAASLGSLMLYTTAVAFNNSRVKDLSARQFDEMTSLAMDTREIVPETVINDFTNEGYSVEANIIEEVNRKAHAAWMGRAAAS